MSKLNQGDRVKYVGNHPTGDVRPGDCGMVVIASDDNGDAHIVFDNSGAGIWRPADQADLEVVSRDS